MRPARAKIGAAALLRRRQERGRIWRQRWRRRQGQKVLSPSYPILLKTRKTPSTICEWLANFDKHRAN